MSRRLNRLTTSDIVPRIRSRLRLGAAVTLGWQLGLLFVGLPCVCQTALRESAAAQASCCEAAEPDGLCPMHRPKEAKPDGNSGPTLRESCGGDGLALLVRLLGPDALAPSQSEVVVTALSTDLPAEAFAHVPDVLISPPGPPPRA